MRARSEKCKRRLWRKRSTSRLERDASGHFPDHEWQRHERRDSAENKDEAHPVHRRALAQVNGVDGKDHHVEHDDDVAPVELAGVAGCSIGLAR